MFNSLKNTGDNSFYSQISSSIYFIYKFRVFCNIIRLLISSQNVKYEAYKLVVNHKLNLKGFCYTGSPIVYRQYTGYFKNVLFFKICLCRNKFYNRKSFGNSRSFIYIKKYVFPHFPLVAALISNQINLKGNRYFCITSSL